MRLASAAVGARTVELSVSTREARQVTHRSARSGHDLLGVVVARKARRKLLDWYGLPPHPVGPAEPRPRPRIERPASHPQVHHLTGGGPGRIIHCEAM
jgi:hypothetical protein